MWKNQIHVTIFSKTIFVKTILINMNINNKIHGKAYVSCIIHHVKFSQIIVTPIVHLVLLKK